MVAVGCVCVLEVLYSVGISEGGRGGGVKRRNGKRKEEVGGARGGGAFFSLLGARWCLCS